MRDYAKVAAPLNNLLKKNTPFIWDENCQQAFDWLKQQIITDAVLHQPDWSKPFVVQTDYSGAAVGAVLSQVVDGVERPISLQSRSLRPAEKNYSPAEGEALAAIWGISIFRPYIHGNIFTLETDCKALTWIMTQKEPTSKLARWAIKLSEYNFTLRHRSGKQNANADALSRQPPEEDKTNMHCMDRPMFPWECLHAMELARHVTVISPEVGRLFGLGAPTNTTNEPLREEIEEERPVECYTFENMPFDPLSRDYSTLPTSPEPFGDMAREKLSGVSKRREEFAAICERMTDYRKYQIEPSIPEDAICKCCQKEGDTSRLVVCDGCNQCVHTHCHSPPMLSVPKEKFFCSECRDGEVSYTEKSSVEDIYFDRAVLGFIVTGDLEVGEHDNAKRIRKRAANYFYDIKSEKSPCIVKKASGSFGDRVVPAPSQRLTLIKQTHENCGHFGLKKTESLLIQNYTWSGMRKDIQVLINGCHACKVTHAKFQSDPVMRPVLIQPETWNAVGIDFAGPFPVLKGGNKYLIIAIDYFTKWIEEKATPDQTAKTAAAFLRSLMDRYGVTKKVHCDNGTHFKAEFQALPNTNKVDVVHSVAYRPQGNGMVERAVRTVTIALKKTVIQEPALAATWDEHLSPVL